MAKVYSKRLRFKGLTTFLFILIILGFGPVGSETRSLSREYLSSLSDNDQSNGLLNNLNIDKIELNVFQHFGNVLSLNLSHNGLHFIRNGTFQGLKKMQVLDLHRNKISTIKSGAFSDLPKLTSLDLRSNDLTSLSDWLRTSRLENLNHLYLDFNNIPLIEHGDFEGLSSLLYLHLSWNGIREKGQGAFSGLEEISGLKVSHFEFLYKLDLSHNHLREVSRNQFLGLHSLIELDLQHNNISSLAENAWAGLINLLELRLCYNRIANLKSSSFSGLGNLNLLFIRYNTISTIQDDAFKGLGSLANLDLTNNRIQVLRSRIFTELQNSLIYLHLEENVIQILSHDTFSNLTHVTRLHLNSNAIVSISPGAFAQLKQLQFLNLSGNALATLPVDIFQATNQVQIIDLSGNDVTILPTGLFSKTLKLKKLDLRRNSLRTLPRNVLTFSSAVWSDIDLKLSGNNLDCNCTLEWFRLGITANKSGTGTREAATCASPPSLRGRFLSDLGKPLSCTRGNDVDNTTHLLPDPSENRTSLNALNVVLFGTLPTLAVVVVIGASVYFAIIKRRRRLSQELPLDHGNRRSPGNADLDAEGVRSSLAASTFVRFSDGHVGEISNTSIDGDSFSTADHTYFHREREELSGNDASSTDYGVPGRMVPLYSQRSWPLYHSTDAHAPGQASSRPIITRTYFGVNNV